MKLLFLILLSVFTIESALASPNPLSWCSKIFYTIKEYSTVSKLKSPHITRSKKERVIKDILKTQEPAVAEDILIRTISEAKYPWIQQDLIENLANVNKILKRKTQLILVDLFNFENTNYFVKEEIVKVLSKIDNPLDELFPFMIQIFDYSFSYQKEALEFFRNKTGPQVTESYKKLLLIYTELSMSTRNDLIKQILDSHEPAVAESLFSQVLSKTQKPMIQQALIKTLEKVAEKNPQHETQLALIDLFQNENTAPFIKRDLAQFLSEIENSVNEVSQFMVQVLKDKKYPSLHKYALQFLKNRDGTQVTEIYKQLLPIIDEISISTREGLIEQILETQEPEVAESLFSQTLPQTQKPMIQQALIKTLEKVAEKNPQHETQLALIYLFQNKNTEHFIKRKIMEVFLKIENPSAEFFSTIDQISKDHLSHYQEDALQILDSNTVNGAVFKLISSNTPSKRQKAIEEIIKIHTPLNIAEAIFLKALPIVQNPLFQVELIHALEKVGSKRTPLALIDLYQDENTNFSVKGATLHALARLENYPSEVFHLMEQILEKSSYITFKRIAREFLKKHKEK